MKEESYALFYSATHKEITEYIATELQKRNESPFWRDKVVPFASAILSVLIPLREAGLLFSPQKESQERLTPELFFEWSDFLSLKILYFTLKRSNEASRLVETKLDEEVVKKYENIDIEELGNYLAKYNVNLQREDLDFPIANYNLHQGVSNVIKSLL